MKTPFFLAAALVLPLCAANLQIIGYYPSWTHGEHPEFNPESIPYSQWNRVTYAFFQVGLDGGLYASSLGRDGRELFGDTAKADSKAPKYKLEALDVPFSEALADSLIQVIPVQNEKKYTLGKGLLERSHNAGVPVYLSIGGWTLSSNFPTVAADPLKRARFASECVRAVKEYGIDGIDIDWEFPAYVEHHGKPEDRDNYVLFLNAIKDSLSAYAQLNGGRKIGLTAALPCSPQNFKNGLQIDKLVPILDQFTLMTYDFHGSWDATAGHNSPLYSKDGLSVDACVQMYHRAGVPKSKINIGAGFYGRAFKGAQKIGDAHQGDGTGFFGSGDVYYHSIFTKLQSKELTPKWDDDAKAPYAVWSGGLVSYEDERSLAFKVKYAKEQGLNGIVVWDMYGDQIGVKHPLLDVLQSDH